MTALQTPSPNVAATVRSPSGQPAARPGSPRKSPRRRPMSTAQRAVVTLAALPLVGIVVTVLAAAAGLIPVNQMVNISLALGEDPGMFVFAAMLWCSPVQWLVKRTQVPVRKMLGILFGGYALANFAMFVVEEGLLASLSAPFLIAGTLAMLASIPLLLTSGRWAQRKMGMRNWRNLHKLTYFIAAALVLHVALIGEIGLSGLMVAAALVVRIPAIADAIRRSGSARRAPAVVGEGR